MPYLRRKKENMRYLVMRNDSRSDTTCAQIRKIASTLRKLAEKIEQGGRQSGLELLPELPRIFPTGKTDGQIQARTEELISTHLREIARRGLRTDALEKVYASNDV